uniref:Selenoprotein F/M domain-containing protein n=1 Tax=Propithecus coquereli TaxID=379532 RepID=A0A2K6G632_PROCO
MPRGFAWLRYLGILLGMALEGLEVWSLTQREECAVTGFLRDKLQYRNRLQYMDVEGSPKVEAVLSLLNTPGLSLKLVRPKALLDNCFRVMELLYCSCCKQSSVLNWQDCEVRSPQPSLQCEAARLYSPARQLPTSPPHSLGEGLLP